MRARGANVTDLVVLVVAADDGVMPQTIEAINHAKAAGVPVLATVNKIDKPQADPDRVKRELAEQGLNPEEWGGDTVFVNVSAKERMGLEDLLEMILLQADILELKANPDKQARGRVIEAKLDVGRGPVATVLVQEGTLWTGNALVCGPHYGKIRAMFDDRGTRLDSAGPSMAVEVQGLSGVPMAGDEFVVVADEKAAKQVGMHRVQKQRVKDLAKSSTLTLEKYYEQMRDGIIKDLNLIIRADVQGSVEALTEAVRNVPSSEVKVNVVHSAAGAMSESDVMLATVSNAIIIGFNVRPNPKVRELAHEHGVEIKFYDVIYNVINDIKKAIVGLMEPTYEERLLGRAEVRETFNVAKVGTIAGCYVTEGKIERGEPVRLLRDGVVVYDGKMGSLRRFKDDVKEVQKGYECGIGIENYNDIKVGDVIECYQVEEVKPSLE
jgi:translation initiation factor IF-2